MKNTLLLGFFLLATAHAASAQVAGGAGAYGGSRSAYRENSPVTPTQLEQNKRLPGLAEQKDEGTSTFIEASVLMNVEADEYVAMFAVIDVGATPAEVTTKVDATLARFKKLLPPLGIKDSDTFVDFVTQNRVYAYKIEDKVATEELAGFELKKNISIRFKDKTLLEKLVAAAAQTQIYDLIKVDYAVKDAAAIQARLQDQTFALIKQKAERYQKQLGINLPAPVQIMADAPSIYFPVDQYESYTAAESENLGGYRSELTIRNARKSRTTFFQPIDGNGFDTVINPVILEPVVQFTTYVKVRYPGEKRQKEK